MNSRFTIVALVAVLGSVLVSSPAANSLAAPKRTPKNLARVANQSCEPAILDACATTLFVFGRRDVYLPQNYAEMVPHCQEEFDAEDCIKNYARKCLAPFERQVAGLLMLGAGQVLRKRCSQEGTREYLTHYTCIKRALPQLHDAMDQLIYTLMALSKGHHQQAQGPASARLKLDDELKIPTSCCSFARFREMAGRIVRATCAEFDAKAEQYISVKMIEGYVGDVLDLSCQGYERLASDKCARIRLPSGGFEWRNQTLARQANSTHLLGPKPNSVVIPFLDIFTNF